MRGFVYIAAAVLAAIGIGVTVIAVQGPSSYYPCPSIGYCLGIAGGLGIREPILASSIPELRARSGLEVRNVALYLNSPGGTADDPGQPVWALEYELLDPANHRIDLAVEITDQASFAWVAGLPCRKRVEVKPAPGYTTPAVAPGGLHFCYHLDVSDPLQGTGSSSNLDVIGRLGAVSYQIDAGSFTPFPGGPASPQTLAWVEGVVGSLKAEPVG